MNEATPQEIPLSESDSSDPEVERVRAVLESRILGVTAAAARIGRFVVLDRIGARTMGVVYAAFDPELDRKVALKLIIGSPGDERRADFSSRSRRTESDRPAARSGTGSSTSAWS